MVVINVCLSDIPGDKIFVSEKTGKEYVSLVVDSNYNGVDNYGNSHNVSISQSKEEREAKVKKIYVGNGKEYVFNKQASSSQPAPAREEASKPQRTSSIPTNSSYRSRATKAAPTTTAEPINDVNGDDLPF